MGIKTPMIGKRFGRLTVVAETQSRKGRAMWICRCDCGQLTTVYGVNLRNGNTRSCGCLHKESLESVTKDINTKHGMCGSRIYRIWLHMKERCTNPNCKSYANYGGRGVKVCNEWSSNFQKFYDWSLMNGYEEHLTIERIDVNGNYEPSNCRWATMKEQANNKRNTVFITHNEITLPITEWAKVVGINYRTLKTRYSSGDRSPEIFRPVKKGEAKA